MNESSLLGVFNICGLQRRLTKMKARKRSVFTKVYRATASLVLAGVFYPANAATWTDVYYELGLENSQAGNIYISPAHITDNTGQPVNTIQTLGGQATISASASPGILRTSVWNIADVQSQALTGVSELSFSTTQASFFDQIMINPTDTSIMGQTGTVNGSLLLSGDMLAIWNVLNNNSSYYDVSASTMLQVSGTGIPGWVQAREIQGSSGGSITNISNPAPTVIPVSFTTTFGSMTGIQYIMNLQGSASASFGFRECGGGYGPCSAIASAELTADYSHTLIWGGISSVTDAYGNPINFNITSASGFDYASPVPVPAAVWLFSSGLLGLIGIARRKKT